MSLLLILRERKEDGEVGTNSEEGLEMGSSENAKDEATELSFVLAEAKEEEKESEEKKAIVRNTPMVPVSDVMDVSIEFVESKEEEGSSNFEGETFVVEKDSEILVQNLIEEESVVHTTEQEVEASEAQESLPTSSVSCEDNSVVYTTAAAITDEVPDTSVRIGSVLPSKGLLLCPHAGTAETRWLFPALSQRAPKTKFWH